MMLAALWVGLGVAIGCAAVLLISAFWPGVEPGEQIAALAGVASASAAVAMFATLHFLQRQLELLREQTSTLREQTDAVLEQTALHTEELRYYYEPGVYVQVHYKPNEKNEKIDGLPVKLFPATQANAFDVWVYWEPKRDPCKNMDRSDTEEPRTKLRDMGLAPQWNCACIAPGQIWWCLLTKEDDGTRLVVTWRHLTDWGWRQVWRLKDLGNDRWDLVPEGPPQREPLSNGE